MVLDIQTVHHILKNTAVQNVNKPFVYITDLTSTLIEIAVYSIQVLQSRGSITSRLDIIARFGWHLWWHLYRTATDATVVRIRQNKMFCSIICHPKWPCKVKQLRQIMCRYVTYKG
jgi:hypothetical protein